MGKYDDLFEEPDTGQGGKYSDLFDEPGVVATQERPTPTIREQLTLLHPEGSDQYQNMLAELYRQQHPGVVAPLSLAEKVRQTILTPTPETPFDISGEKQVEIPRRPIEEPLDELAQQSGFQQAGLTDEEAGSIAGPFARFATSLRGGTPQEAEELRTMGAKTLQNVATPENALLIAATGGTGPLAEAAQLAFAGQGGEMGYDAVMRLIHAKTPEEKNQAISDLFLAIPMVASPLHPLLRERSKPIRGAPLEVPRLDPSATVGPGTIRQDVSAAIDRMPQNFTLVPEPKPPLAPAPTVEETLAKTAPPPPLTPHEHVTQVLANRQRILSEIEALRPQVMQARKLMPNGHPQLEAEWADLNAQLNNKETNPVVHAPPPEAGTRTGVVSEGPALMPGAKPLAPVTPPEAPRAAPTKAIVAPEPTTPLPYTREAAEARGTPNTAPETPAGGGVATKHAATEAARETRGLAPVEQAAAQDFPAAWEKSRVELEQDPELGRRLVDQLKVKPAAVDDVQNAHLLRETIRRQGEYDAAVKAVNDSAQGTQENVDAQVRLAKASQDYYDVHQADRNAGTGTSRGLNARKMLADDQYNLAKMQARRRAASGGRPLTKRQMAETKAMSEKLSAVKEKIGEAEGGALKAGLDAEFKKLVVDLDKKVGGGAGPGFWDNLEAGARGRIRERTKNASMQVDPTVLVDVAQIGAAKIYRGISDRVAWGKDMVADLGDWVTPHLDELWRRAKELHDAATRGVRNEHDIRISTRRPTGGKRTEDWRTTQLDLGTERLLKDPKYAERVAKRLREWLPKEIQVKSDFQQIENAINFFKENKLHLYEMASKYPWLERAMRQYEGYNIHGHNLAEKYGRSPEGVFGAESVLSPGTSPDQSFSMVERLLDVLQNGRTTRWDKSFDATARGIPQKILKKVRGKTFDELQTPLQRAAWARVYSELHHARGYEIIHPEGVKGGVEGNISWASGRQIADAIEMLEGRAHPRDILKTPKVSNYFNAKLAPNSYVPDYVADRHDVSGGYGFPIGTEKGNTVSKLLNEHFGGFKNAHTGDYGMYGIQAEAGRRGAQEVGTTPGRFQAGIWSYQRGFLAPRVLGREVSRQIQDVWKSANRGDITIREARALTDNIAQRALAKKIRETGYNPHPAFAREHEGSGGERTALGPSAAQPKELPGVRGIEGTTGPGGGSGSVAGGVSKSLAHVTPEVTDHALLEGLREQFPTSEQTPADVTGVLNQVAGLRAGTDGYYAVIPPFPEVAPDSPGFTSEGPFGTREEAQDFIDAEVGAHEVRIVEVRNARPVNNPFREEKPVTGRTVEQPALPAPARQADWLDRAAERARERMRGRLGHTNVAADPQVLADVAIVGAKHIRDGIRDRVAWGKKVAEDFGDWVKPHLDDLYKKSTDLYNRYTDKNLRAYQTRLTRQTEELKAKLAAGDYTKSVRKKMELDKATFQLKAEYDRVKQDFDREVRRDELLNRPWLKRAADTVVKAERAIKLTGATIYGKLASAAATRLVTRPIEQMVQSAIGQIPGLHTVHQAAPLSGFNPRAERAALGGVAKGIKEFKQRMRGDYPAEEVAYGKPHLEPPSWLDIPGRTHAAVKAPVQEAERARATVQLEEHARKQGLDLNDPRVRQDIGEVANQQAKRSIFMQDNFISNGWQGLIRTMEQSKTHPTAGFISAKAAQILLPIVKVPTNIALETGTHMFGTVTATAKLGQVMHRGMSTIKPEEANMIMRHYSKGMVGAGLFLTGYFLESNGQYLGGFYQPGKREEGAVAPMGARIAGVDIPSWLLHAPAFIVMQAGATAYHMAHHVNKQGEPDKSAVLGVAKGLVEEIPFMKEMGVVDNLLSDSYEGRKARGNLGTGLVIPQLVKEAAKYTDPVKEPDYRTPKNTLDYFKLGIPGLREQVPLHSDVSTAIKKHRGRSGAFAVP